MACHFQTSVWRSDPYLLHDAVVSEPVQGIKDLCKVSCGSIQPFVLRSITSSGSSFSLSVRKSNDVCEEKKNALYFPQFCIAYYLNQLFFNIVFFYILFT